MKTTVIVNRGLDGKFQKMYDALEEVGQVYGRKFAESLTELSPVDTGTYMRSFYVDSAPQVGSYSSEGKPRNQPYDQVRQSAMSDLLGQIAALKGSTRMVFGNNAEHATDVEYGENWQFTPGYAPFGVTRNKHSQLMREAWEEVIFR